MSKNSSSIHFRATLLANRFLQIVCLGIGLCIGSGNRDNRLTTAKEHQTTTIVA
jgi:hypothetical protein